MLIPAITEAIIALAAGSVAGVAIAIERGLASLIALVINLFAKLIGLGGLSKKVMAIFSKIRKRVDKVVMKLLNKAKKAGRKLLGKLGIGAKEKPKNKEQHDEQVKAGLAYLKQQTTKLDKDGDKALTQEEAKKAASITKSKFVVFKSITPKEKNGKWSFHWKASDGEFDSDKEAGGEKIELKKNIEPALLSDVEVDAQLQKLRDYGVKSVIFRGDDSYNNEGIGFPIGSEEYENAEVKDFKTHVKQEKDNRDSIYRSFSIRMTMEGGKGPTFFAKKGKILKIDMEALKQLVKEGKIKIYTPEDVKSILLKDKKMKKAAQGIYQDMLKHGEILIEGHIPAEYVMKTK